MSMGRIELRMIGRLVATAGAVLVVAGFFRRLVRG